MFWFKDKFDKQIFLPKVYADIFQIFLYNAIPSLLPRRQNLYFVL
jgi:hypothetical protein